MCLALEFAAAGANVVVASRKKEVPVGCLFHYYMDINRVVAGIKLPSGEKGRLII